MGRLQPGSLRQRPLLCAAQGSDHQWPWWALATCSLPQASWMTQRSSVSVGKNPPIRPSFTHSPHPRPAGGPLPSLPPLGS